MPLTLDPEEGRTLIGRLKRYRMIAAALAGGGGGGGGGGDSLPPLITDEDFQGILATWFKGGALGNFWLTVDTVSDGAGGTKIASRIDGEESFNTSGDYRAVYNGQVCLDHTGEVTQQTSLQGITNAKTGVAFVTNDNASFAGNQQILGGDSAAAQIMARGLNATNDIYAYDPFGFGIDYGWRSRYSNQIPDIAPTTGITPIVVGRKDVMATLDWVVAGNRDAGLNAWDGRLIAWGVSDEVIPPEVVRVLWYYLNHNIYGEVAQGAGLVDSWPGWITPARAWRNEASPYATYRDRIPYFGWTTNRGGGAKKVNGSWLHGSTFDDFLGETDVLGGTHYGWMKANAISPVIDHDLSNWTRTGGDGLSRSKQDNALGVSRTSWRILVTEDLTFTSPSGGAVSGNHTFSFRSRVVHGTAPAGCELRLKDGAVVVNTAPMTLSDERFVRSHVWVGSTVDRGELFFEHTGEDYVVEVTMIMYSNNTLAPEPQDTMPLSEAPGSFTPSGQSGGLYEVTPPGASGQIIVTAWVDPGQNVGTPAASPTLLATGYKIQVQEGSGRVRFEFNGGAEVVDIDINAIGARMLGWWGASVKWDGVNAHCAVFNAELGIIGTGQVATTDVWGAGTYRSVILGSDGLAVNHISGLCGITYIDAEFIDGAGIGDGWDTTAAMLQEHFAEAEAQRDAREAQLYPQPPLATHDDLDAQGFTNLVPASLDDWNTVNVNITDEGDEEWYYLATLTSNNYLNFFSTFDDRPADRITANDEVVHRIAYYRNNGAAVNALGLRLRQDGTTNYTYPTIKMADLAVSGDTWMQDVRVRRWRDDTALGTVHPGFPVYVVELRFRPTIAIDQIRWQSPSNYVIGGPTETVRLPYRGFYSGVRTPTPVVNDEVMTGWTVDAGVTVDALGNGEYRVNFDRSATQSIRTPAIAADVGGKYRLSFEARLESGSVSLQYAETQEGAPTYGKPIQQILSALDGDWQQFMLDSSALGADTISIAFRSYDSDDAAMAIDFRNVRLQRLLV